METSILQQIKKKAGRFIEKQILKTGYVLHIRESAGMIEIDLHLPFVDMRLWNQIPYIKFRVDELCFRDYTPYSWNSEESTCSLLIDTAHKGPGSLWAKQLKAGDNIKYLKIESTQQSPHPTALVVGLGDSSSLAHLIALQQLTLPVTRFDGAILLDNHQNEKLYKNYFHSPVNILLNRTEMVDWLLKQNYCTIHTWFCLTGNHHMVSELRGILKNLGHSNIRVKGFWS